MMLINQQVFTQQQSNTLTSPPSTGNLMGANNYQGNPSSTIN